MHRGRRHRPGGHVRPDEPRHADAEHGRHRSDPLQHRLPGEHPVRGRRLRRRGGPGRPDEPTGGMVGPDQHRRQRPVRGRVRIDDRVCRGRQRRRRLQHRRSNGAPTPVSNSLPEITGTAQEGQTAERGPRAWLNDPTGYSYQWELCDTSGNNCSTILGATSHTYTLIAADIGHTIRVIETAANPGGWSSPTPRSRPRSCSRRRPRSPRQRRVRRRSWGPPRGPDAQRAARPVDELPDQLHLPVGGLQRAGHGLHRDPGATSHTYTRQRLGLLADDQGGRDRHQRRRAEQPRKLAVDRGRPGPSPGTQSRRHRRSRASRSRARRSASRMAPGHTTPRATRISGRPATPPAPTARDLGCDIQLHVQPDSGTRSASARRRATHRQPAARPRPRRHRPRDRRSLGAPRSRRHVGTQPRQARAATRSLRYQWRCARACTASGRPQSSR